VSDGAKRDEEKGARAKKKEKRGWELANDELLKLSFKAQSPRKGQIPQRAY